MKVRKINEWTQQERRAFTKWISGLSSGIDYMKPGLYAIIDKAVEIATREKKYRIIKDPVNLVGSIEENVKALDTIAIKDILLWFAYSGHPVSFGYHYPDVKDYRLKTSEMASGHTIPDFCVEEYTDD